MDDVAVLINTWDGYSACWEPMVHGLKKYWPDCPWPIYWMCNKKAVPMGTAIRCESANWGAMTASALERIKEEYFIFLHEDYWLTERVATGRLVDYGNVMRTYQIDHIQLAASWDVMRHDGIFRDNLLWVHRESDYRTSNQASLWRRKSYLDILVAEAFPYAVYPERFSIYPNMSPWAWEMLKVPHLRCLAVDGRPISWPIKYVYRHLPDWDLEPVVKGKWTADAAKYCEWEGIPLPYNYREGGDVREDA